MRRFRFILWLAIFGFSEAQDPFGLRRLSHEEIKDLVSNATLVFSTGVGKVSEYHGTFVDGVVATAYRNWEGQVVEGRLFLMDETPGMVCYRYTDSQSNCAYFVEDSKAERIYLDFIDIVQQQTVEVIPGDNLDLQRRIQIPYWELGEDSTNGLKN